MKILNLHDIIKRVIATEKSASLGSTGVYTVVIDSRSTKKEVKTAFESLYGAKVISVNVARTAGKTKKFRGTIGRVSGFKKAFVRLSGEKQIDFTKVS